MLLLLVIFLIGCQPQITSFEECVDAGNPVMESYPRQCAANGQTFVEEIEEPSKEADFHECTQEEKQADICTLDYTPVCGLTDNNIRCITTPCASTDAKTFSNGCSACSAQALGYYQGSCDDQQFVVCGETVTGFDPVEFAQSNGGICVDTCPGNYDPFVTQIGITLCIPHYGVEEISQWEECSRSSNTCNCVRTYETTREEQIENAPYRCVPELYAQRLLFRGGQDSLDENGQQSVIIA